MLKQKLETEFNFFEKIGIVISFWMLGVAIIIGCGWLISLIIDFMKTFYS